MKDMWSSDVEGKGKHGIRGTRQGHSVEREGISRRKELSTTQRLNHTHIAKYLFLVGYNTMVCNLESCDSVLCTFHKYFD